MGFLLLLLSIKGLQNWNVSNGNDLSYMFFGCSSLSDIKELQNWKLPDWKYKFMFENF